MKKKDFELGALTTLAAVENLVNIFASETRIDSTDLDTVLLVDTQTIPYSWSVASGRVEPRKGLVMMRWSLFQDNARRDGRRYTRAADIKVQVTGNPDFSFSRHIGWLERNFPRFFGNEPSAASSAPLGNGVNRSTQRS